MAEEEIDRTLNFFRPPRLDSMDSARLVGTTAIGLGAGYMLAVPFHFSAFRTLVDLSPRQKLVRRRAPREPY